MRAAEVDSTIAGSTALRAALAASLHDVYTVGLLVAIAAALAALFLKEIPLRGRERDARTEGATVAA